MCMIVSKEMRMTLFFSLLVTVDIVATFEVVIRVIVVALVVVAVVVVVVIDTVVVIYMCTLLPTNEEKILLIVENKSHVMCLQHVSKSKTK
jgi:hypothetical protein